MTDGEDARITAAAKSDPDCPPLTGDRLKKMRPFVEAYPELARALRAARGRPKLDDPKVQVTLRLDAAVVQKFRAGGPGWQSRINDVLANATKRRKRA